MTQCFRCGVSDEKEKLYDAISNEGVVKVCFNCSSVENLPIIKKISSDKFNESPRQKSVHERLTGMSRGTRQIGREVSLRELIDRDLKAKKIQTPSDLVDNFHWIIQRIRRVKKITREEFARGISEPESTVRMIEQGFLPENNYKIINKIESFLGTSLRKPGSSGFPDTSEPVKKYTAEPIEQPELAFDEKSTKKLKIADLLGFKKKQEEKKKEEKTSESWEEEYSQDDERFLDAKEEEEEFEEE